MKRKNIFIILLLTLCSFIGFGQEASSSKERIYKAYTSGRAELWKEEIENLDNRYNNDNSSETLRELLMAEYAYIPFCLKENLKKEAADELERARELLSLLRQNDSDNPELIAIEAALTGFEMGIHPIKALILGQESVRLTDEAYQKDPDNLTCISVKANQLNFTPSFFGGSVTESIYYYNRVLELFDSGRVEKASDWRYINTLVILAGAYETLERYDEACLIYEKIIATDPDIRWVNSDLYPAALLKKAESQDGLNRSN